MGVFGGALVPTANRDQRFQGRVLLLQIDKVPVRTSVPVIPLVVPRVVRLDLIVFQLGEAVDKMSASAEITET